MKISVVMPVWNEEVLVDRAIQSMLCQTESHFELVIVDDGSSDGTPVILASWAARDQRIRVVSIPHQGIVAALQAGVAAAQGEYIARMDADDFSHPQRLELQARFLDQHPEIGLVSCRVRYGGDASKYRGLALFVAQTNDLMTPEAISNNRFIESPIIHPSVMFRRNLVAQFGGYRGGMFPEDYELWLRWMDAGVKMAKVPETLFVWHEREKRLTRTDERCSTDAFYRCKSLWLAKYLAAKNPFHPHIWVWGAGQRSRKRLRYLCDQGVEVRAYIDVDPQKIGKNFGGIPCIGLKEIPPPGECFILNFVGNRGARCEIENWLVQRHYRVGVHYISGS